LDSCYGQNLGFDVPPSTADSISCLLEGQRQLDEWRLHLLPSLGLRIWDSPISAEDLERLDVRSIHQHRFNIVLSMRYNNLRILLYRRRLESFLETFWSTESTTTHDMRLLKQMDLGSVESCIESAVSIISIVHCIAMSSAWRRDLLGAWNYSLYYSKSIRFFLLINFELLLIIASVQRRIGHLWDAYCGFERTPK
jgi:hypothetical protein